MGEPSAQRGDQEVRLRSKKARAVLASLLVPLRLTSPFSTPASLSRQTIAERFWGDKTDPRGNLRQLFDQLTDLFGNDCFQADNYSLRAVKGAFVTDIDRIRHAYQQALAAPTAEERLHFLIEAEGELHGPFLEACLLPGDFGEAWLIGRRAEVHGWIATVLFALADAFEEAGNLNGAMETARRAVAFVPESAPAQARVWRLSEKTGQEAALSMLDNVHSFEHALERVQGLGKTAQLTGRETRLFQVLYQRKVALLDPALQKALPRLAFFPAPFPAALARDVAGVSPKSLRQLAQTPLLERNGDEYALPEAVGNCALRTVPSATRQQMDKRLAFFCEAWVENAVAQRGNQSSLSAPPPFDTLAKAKPFLQSAMHWSLKQPPTLERLHIVDNLFVLDFHDIAREAVPYLEKFYAEETLPAKLRQNAMVIAGRLFFDVDKFPEAIVHLQQALTLAPLVDDLANESNLHYLLANAYHYAGKSEEALIHVRATETIYERREALDGVAACLRFRAEILNHLGRYNEALEACDKAVTLRRILYPGGNPLADALFWKASTLFRLNRFTEVGTCVEEALVLWQDTGDKNGIGFCLRLLGRLRATEERLGEAGAHLDHAILYHERAGDRGSRLAAVEARADVYFQAGRSDRAFSLYEECLTYHESALHTERVEMLKASMQRCQHAGTSNASDR